MAQYNGLKPRDAGGLVVHSEGAVFNEAGGSTLTASIDIPAGAIVTKVSAYTVAQWASATSASLIAGDTSNDDGFIEATDMKAATVDAEIQGGLGAEAYDAPKYYAAADTITFTLTETGAGATGQALAWVEWIEPTWTAAA